MNTENNRFLGLFRKKAGAAHKPFRLLTAMGLAGMLFAASLPGCAIDDQAANYSAGIFIAPGMETFVEGEWVLSSKQGGNTGTIAPVAPIQFAVLDNNRQSIDWLPVPGAEVTIFFGGGGLQGAELFDWTGTSLTDTGIYNAIADDHGIVEMFVMGQLPDCPPAAEEYDLLGNLTIAGHTQSTNAVWTINWTLTCVP